MTLRIENSNRRSSIGYSKGSILPAKVSPPELPRFIVPRPRVDKCIEKGTRRGSVTIVSGPPGAGKTVALAQWLAASRWPGPIAWLSLDEYDDAAEHFWPHLAAALTRAGVGGSWY
jgi:LuxR family transcriptional regulator, maltose regulon positive regulatory protein